jgi:hypothetical protein
MLAGMRASLVPVLLVLYGVSSMVTACDSSSSKADAGASDAASDTSGVTADAGPTDVAAAEAPPADGNVAEAAPGDVAATDAAPDDAAARATVMGTLTLPAATTGKPWSVRLAPTQGGVLTPIAEASSFTTGTAQINYTIAGVPAGTYFLLGFVDVDGSGGVSSTPGDFAGWYGHNGDGNPPAQANVVVPATGIARFDFSLVLR